MKTSLCLTLLASIAASTYAQASRQSSLSDAPAIVISGRVIADATGNPIANARVMLSPEPQTGPVTVTDADGRFSLTADAGRRAAPR